MRKLLLLSLGIAVLTSCHPVAPPTDEVMSASATLPASVGATEDLIIGLQVTQGCTFFSKVNVVERTASKLGIQVIGTKKIPCPAVPNAAAYDFSYIDTAGPSFEVAGNPVRTNPFEVWVNGGKVGVVTIK